MGLWKKALDTIFRREYGTSSLDREAQKIHDAALLAKGTCPSCKTPNSMLVGPRGAAARNIACGQCHEEFNVLMHNGQCFIIERMGRAPPDRFRSIYGAAVSTTSI
jgi:hypothetical protein